MIHIIRPCFYLFIIISPLISCSEDLPKIKKDQKKEEVIDLFNTEKIFHDGFEREYILFIPESYDVNSKFPLMLNFHAYSGTASGHVYISDMRSISNLENFILVYPQGLGNVWNPSLNFDNSSKNKTDDFGFIEAVIREISSNYKIDTSRVYATGFSNGAGMAHALACVLNNKIAAIASMSGLLYKHTAENSNPEPTAIMTIHGTADNDRPYDGIDDYYLSIDNMHQYWINRNKTDKLPSIRTFDFNGQTVEHHSYKNGTNNTPIEHYKVINGKHLWFDFLLKNSNTNRLIWDFVSKYDVNGLR